MEKLYIPRTNDWLRLFMSADNILSAEEEKWAEMLLKYQNLTIYGTSKEINKLVQISSYIADHLQFVLQAQPLFCGEIIVEPHVRYILQNKSRIVIQNNMSLVETQWLFFEQAISNVQTIFYPL